MSIADSSVAKPAGAACLLLTVVSLYRIFSITFCLNTDRDSSRVAQRSYLYPSPTFIPVPPLSQSLLYLSPSFISVPPISQSLLYLSPSFIPVLPITQSLLGPSPPISQSLRLSALPSFLLPYRSNAKQQFATEQATNTNRIT
jgi:hypothetical protein